MRSRIEYPKQLSICAVLLPNDQTAASRYCFHAYLGSFQRVGYPVTSTSPAAIPLKKQVRITTRNRLLDRAALMVPIRRTTNACGG